MRKTNILSLFIEKELFHSKNKYLIMILMFLIGVVLGAVTSETSNSSMQIKDYVNRFTSSYLLHGTIKNQVFLLSLLNYSKYIFFLWISGWYSWLFPLCFLQVFTKGFRIGFTITCFIKILSFRGILISVLTLLPQNLMFLPALFFFSVYQFQFLSERREILSGKNNLNHQMNCYKRNLFYFFLFATISLLCALIEGYLVPAILQSSSFLFK